MFHLTHPSRLARTLLVLLGSGCIASTLIGAEVKEYENRSFGYALQYPSDWYPQIRSDVFYIESFPPSKAVRAVRLPERGAGIKVLVPLQVIRKGQKVPGSLQEWAAHASSGERVISRRTTEVISGQRRLPIIEVEAQCCAVAPYQTSVDWYFEVDGRMFVSTLVYWEGNPDAEKLRETLKQVVLSLQVTNTEIRGKDPLPHVAK